MQPSDTVANGALPNLIRLLEQYESRAKAMATIEIQMAKRVGRRRTVIPAHQQRKKTDFLTVHDRSITFNVRQERVGQVHQWYSLARHVATSQADLRRSTRSKAPDSPGPDEAAQGYIPECCCHGCGMITHTQKTEVIRLALSFLEHPSTADITPGHESRLIAVTEVCKTNGLPNEITLMVLAMVQPIGMYRYLFMEPGARRWWTVEDSERRD